MLVGLVLLILFVAQSPAEAEQQIRALRDEIAATKAEVKALRRQHAEKEAREKEQRAVQARARLRVIEREAREARKRVGKPNPTPTPEPLESPEVKTAREARLQELLKVENPDEDQRLTLALARERAALQAKVDRANKRWHCRVFKIGCIGKR